MGKRVLRTLSLCIAAAFALTLCGLAPMFGARAADIVDRGFCGDNVMWTLDSDGVLTISGAGAMYGDYGYDDDGNLTPTPWYEARDNILTVVIENGVLNIGKEAFSNCSAMGSVAISDSVTSIDDHAFYGCTSLTSVTIPNSVTSIDGGAFYGCESLTSVTISDSVTYIGLDAFKNCKKLIDVYYGGSATQWSEIFISDYDNGNDALKNATIHYNAQDVGVGITLTDENGDTVDANGKTGETEETKKDAFQDGAEFTATFNAVEPDAASGLVTASVFIVFYDKDGLMVDLTQKEIDLSNPLNLLFVLDIRVPEGAKTLKFLILGDNFEPLRAVRMIEDAG